MGESEDVWTPVTRVETKVKGVNLEFAGLIDVNIHLNQEPPPDWIRFFEAAPMLTSMHPPEVIRNLIGVRAPDDELESYVEDIDDRIAIANTRYEAEVAPRVEAQRRAQERQQVSDRERVEEAQRRLDGL